MIFCFLGHFQMPSLNKNKRAQCGYCGNTFVAEHAARHGKTCQAGNISCPDCRYFTYNKQEKKYHLAKKLTPSTSKQSTVCLCCEKEFPGCYSLQQPRREEYGAIQPKSSDTVAELNKIVEEERDDGEKPKEELCACHYLLRWRMGDIRRLFFKCQS